MAPLGLWPFIQQEYIAGDNNEFATEIVCLTSRIIQLLHAVAIISQSTKLEHESVLNP